MDLNNLPPYLKMSDIVSSRKGDRPGLVPFGRSKWLEYRKAGKIPKGRQNGAPNSPVIYSREEVLSVIQMIETGELAL